MAHLNPIAPLGVGTKDVESIASLVMRSAARHVVPTMGLLQFCSTNLGREPGGELNFCRFRIADLVRPNPKNHAVLEGIGLCSNLCYDDLVKMTFFGVGKTVGIAGFRNALAKNVRWCPACFSEWNAGYGTPYLKLSWSLIGHVHCEDHRVKLIEECPHCSSKQNSTMPNHDLSFCNTCEKSLYDDESLKPEERPQPSGDLMSLVYATATLPISEFPDNGAMQSLRDIYIARGECEFERKHWDCYLREFYLDTTHKTSISVVLARRIAVVLVVPLLDIILGNGYRATRSLAHKWPCTAEMLSEPQPRSIGWLGVALGEEQLKDYIARSELGDHVPSIAEIARDLDCSTGALEYRYRGLCDRLVAIRKRQLKEARDRHFKNASSCVSETIGNHPDMGSKKLVGMLRYDTGIPVYILRKAIQKQRVNR
jgi:hypothetical protein